MNENFKSGFIFTPYKAPEQSDFDRLFDIFSELITHTSGDVDEALNWFKILDEEYKLTNRGPNWLNLKQFLITSAQLQAWENTIEEVNNLYYNLKKKLENIIKFKLNRK